ncbi:MAG: sigma-54-dependent Fis family transcriptional regulator [Burkholderiales bacterium]|nr:sigma-54-dependent Fis family transcriptional regulator [Burkholderiales bacterium]
MNRPPPPSVLLVDDDPLIVETLSLALGHRFHIETATTRTDAIARLRALPAPPPLALIDLGLPPTPHLPDEGYRLITSLLTLAPQTKIVVLSGQAAEASGRHARALGAIEFVAKPVSPARLIQVLEDALAAGQAESAAPSVVDPLAALIGTSAPMLGLKTQIRLVATSPFPVLIEGESGSGKEVVAGALHALSGRGAAPYLALNCAAIAPALVEPTLFGYAKGSFTGAVGARAGYFEDARDGTLFLDEIGELPLELQAKLLRVLENGEYNRVGETQSRRSQARVITATNRDLRASARGGGFRADLYHRLSVFTLRVPPLRDLGDDKLVLLEHFSAIYAQKGARPFALEAQARRLWQEYPFPGNVRELRNVVIRLATRYPGQALSAEQLEAEFDSGATLAVAASADDATRAARDELARRGPFDLDARLAHWERAYIAAAMQLAAGNISQAARLLGINRTTLYSRMAALERDAGADVPERDNPQGRS